MNKLQLFFSFLFVALFAVSCGSLGDAGEYGKEFHEHFKANDYEAMALMVSEEGLEATPKEDWIAVFEAANTEYGDIISYKKTGFNMSTSNGTSKIVLSYTLKFETITLYEKLHLIKVGENEYKVKYYEYNENASKLSD